MPKPPPSNLLDAADIFFLWDFLFLFPLSPFLSMIRVLSSNPGQDIIKRSCTETAVLGLSETARVFMSWESYLRHVTFNPFH